MTNECREAGECIYMPDVFEEHHEGQYGWSGIISNGERGRK